MKSIIRTHDKSASLRLARGLVRTASVTSMVVTFSVGSVSSLGLSGLGLLGVIGLTITAATPAQARCLIGGEMRYDIHTSDCLEAQRTGCVRSMLTSVQYKNCLRANQGRKDCIIGGKVRNDLSELDCEEAKATGCVRRLLTTTQYQACLDAQPPKQ
jgi:hypothetical protein